MASRCPNCHAVLDEEAICCAQIQHTWKCDSCGKLSHGLVVPYGRCFLCGGPNRVVKPYAGDDPAVVQVVQEAVQFEVDMFHFYRLACARVTDDAQRAVLTELLEKEGDHLEELEQKYHLHLDPGLKQPTAEADGVLSKQLFDGIDFGDGGPHVRVLYDRAIDLERRTRDHFQARADALPPGTERELYRELAAEEEEHVAILEGERDQVSAPEEW